MVQLFHPPHPLARSSFDLSSDIQALPYIRFYQSVHHPCVTINIVHYVQLIPRIPGSLWGEQKRLVYNKMTGSSKFRLLYVAIETGTAAHYREPLENLLHSPKRSTLYMYIFIRGSWNGVQGNLGFCALPTCLPWIQWNSYRRVFARKLATVGCDTHRHLPAWETASTFSLTPFRSFI